MGYLFAPKKDLKPIKWIGTQRSVYTHRKKQKRIKDLISKAKCNKQANQKTKAAKSEKAIEVVAEKDEAMYEDVQSDIGTVTVFLVKDAPLLNNGLGQGF